MILYHKFCTVGHGCVAGCGSPSAGSLGQGPGMQPCRGVAGFAWHPASAHEVCFSLGLIKQHFDVALLLPTLKLALPGVLAGNLPLTLLPLSPAGLLPAAPV